MVRTELLNEQSQMKKAWERAIKLLIAAYVVGACIDPFFLYIPFLNDTKKCLGINKNLWKVATALRTVADSVYYLSGIQLVLRIVRTLKIKYFAYFLKTNFNRCLFWFALAPIPQILFSEKFILKTLRDYTIWGLILFCHFGTRQLLIFKISGPNQIILAWFASVLYLVVYLTVSHAIGAFWYYLSIIRQVSCWHRACKLIDTGCVDHIFRCDDTTTSTLNSTLVNEFCPINPQNTTAFDYGIYLDALQSGIVEDKGLLKKILRCFFWGLRNLSSFASNLVTSPNHDETLFAIIISVVALILLIYIIGNIQMFAGLESARSDRILDQVKLITPKIELLVKSHELEEETENYILRHIQEEWANNNDSFNLETLRTHIFIKSGTTITDSLIEDFRFLEKSILNRKLDIQEKAEKWLSDNNIPPDQNNILFYLTSGLEDDQDVNLKSVFSVLPDEPKWITKKDLCFETLRKVPRLQNIDEEWFIRMRSKLKPVVYPEESYIFREGKSLDFIIFITNGIAWSYTTSTGAGGRVSVSIKSLEKGDFFGEELLEWKLEKIRELNADRIPLSCIPISTADVKSHTQVEAFVLMINDLALSSDFPVATSKLWRIIRKRMIVNAFIRKLRNADSATEGVDRSSRSEEGASAQGEIEEVNIITE